MEGRLSGALIGCLLVVSAVLQASWGAGSEDNVQSLEDMVSRRDQARLEQVLVRAEPYDTIEEAYLVARGAAALGRTTSTDKLTGNACKFVMARQVETLGDTFFSLSIGALQSNCKIPTTAKMRSLVQEGLKSSSDIKELYYAITSAMIMKMEVDTEALVASLVSAVENEDTARGYAYAFLAASFIPEADLSTLFDSIEDIVAQADETPSTLYFDGGLGVTGDVVNGIFALAERVGSEPTLTETQATKFGNFLVTSKYTSSLAEAVSLLTAARALSSNKYVVPVAVTLANSQPISSSNPDLALQLATLMGGAVEGVTLKVKSLEDPSGDLNPRTRTMTGESDKITFSYPMFKDTTGAGQYTVTVGMESKSPSPFVKLNAVELPVIVSFQVAVGSAQFSIVDKDQGVTTKSLSLDYPNTSKASLQADQHSKVVMTFTLTNKGSSEPVIVHQAFVRLALGAEEIFFVATPNAEKQYSFELDVADSAKDFGQLSGTYSLTLMVGDFALENPFSWNVASVELKFPGTSSPKEENAAYKPKPKIEHLFRVPEKRPPMMVSTAFTVMVFLPLLVLIIVWLVMGANFSNIASAGIWGVFFHIGLGGILGLYYCFWAQLNMFATLKYLFVLGGFTFLTGNRMLRNIAKARQP